MNFRRSLLTIALGYLILSFHIVKAVPQVTFLGIDKGLSNASVRTIYQDHKGFLWFGTYDGLNRYDGYNFKVFRNQVNDPRSLVNNYIFTIAEDNAFNLWVGTHGGASKYNNVSGKFEAIAFYPRNSKLIERIDFGIRVIGSLRSGDMLLGTLGYGMMVYRKGAKAAFEIPLMVSAKPIWDYNVQAIKIDKNNVTWVLVPQYGLCRLDRGQRSLTLVERTLKNAFCIEPDQVGNIWMGTGEGLYKYDPKRSALTKVLQQGPGGLTFNKVSDMKLTKNSELWMAINGGGVNIYNTVSGKLTYLQKDNGKSALSNVAAYTIFQDKDDRFWIGISNSGVNILDPKKVRFNTVSHDPSDLRSLPDKAIYAIYQDKSDAVWIGTEAGGVSVWDRKKGTFTNFTNDRNDPHSLSDNIVTSMIGDDRDDIWLATFFNGINKFNKASRDFTRYKCINPLSSTENKVVSTLCQDKQGRIWAGTLKGDGINGALYQYNKNSDKFEAYDTGLSDVFVLSLDRSSALWAGVLDKLVLIDRKDRKHRFYDMGYYVRNIFEDTSGKFWIGTEGGGLVQFDRSSGKIIARYTVENGLSNNSVLNILEDKRGDLWLSTFNGLSKFDPRTRKFKNYYKSDGLQSNQFHYNSKAALRSGELLFGGIDGLNVFFPDKVVDINSTPSLILSGVSVNNEMLQKNSRAVTQASADMIRSIEVPYNDAVLAFDFTALEYTAPDKISYAYIMDGWDHDWTYSGGVRSANYTHLNEGTYTFRVKCTNAEGQWMKKQVSLTVHILPPWYRSWWAYLLYVSALAACIYAYLYYHKKQTLLKFEVKLVNELNDKKIAFFTNISHELRTPLTLIVNPIKELLHSNGSDTHLIDISSVYRNSRRLLSLVDQLLLFRNSDNEIAPLQPTILNLTEICHEVFLCFNNQVKSKEIEYSFDPGGQQLWIMADREKIEIVLFNLISNAIKYSPRGGAVKIEILDQNGLATVTVSDNGKGIPAKTGEKLFDKFYRLQQDDGNGESGFGIGLFLAKRYMDLHQGHLSYISEVGVGTTFKIGLPLLNENEVAQMKDEFQGSQQKRQHLLEELIMDTEDVLLPDNRINEHVDTVMDDIVSQKPVVLLIDDDEEVRKYIRKLLRHDYIIYEASNTDSGFEAVLEFEPDIIVCDVVMQGMSGVEFCSKMKETQRLSHIPIILLTGTSSPEVKLKGFECGADDYITKPFENDLLVARIKSLIKKRDSLKDYFLNEITLQNNSLKVPIEYSEFLSKCIEIIEKYMEDENFTVQVLTEEIGMSKSKLYRKIKSISGLASSEFIRYIRLRKAAELMINTDAQVKEIAYKVGFADIKYFREHFNKLFKMNPSEFIRKYRNAYSTNQKLNDSISSRHRL